MTMVVLSNVSFALAGILSVAILYRRYKNPAREL
jgi:hypothetical protein